MKIEIEYITGDIEMFENVIKYEMVMNDWLGKIEYFLKIVCINHIYHIKDDCIKSWRIINEQEEQIPLS